MKTEFWRNKALPYVESRRACDSRTCYLEHSHPTYSIGAVDSGSSIFTGAPDGPIELTPGSLVLVPAHRSHACNPLPDQSWSYQMLHLDAIWLEQLWQESTGLSLKAQEPIRVSHEPLLYAAYCELNALLFSAAPVLNKEAALIEFLLHHWPAHGQLLAPAPPPSPVLQKSLDRWIDGQLSTIPLHELAQETGFSRYQLIRAFRRHTGLTPQRWQLNQRVNLARDALKQGEELADIAYRLGFSDQSHFQRVFKHYTGVTPGQYRG
ncbi:AraC family transcriptional regulator [Alcaligenes aquatilis]|uniref:AraC family transcriptional regulator n=1 Tax=Alcaligenes aquatilis TaxID=323284 RepID=A0ABY4NHZ7_9BURK|nr:AraC family transcriptional regulator [Alcaligenes aquatilis]UQN36017.1 AraC family transcriptional regulator [Alcaligenes aquatilis]